jgi:hypothetical protein
MFAKFGKRLYRKKLLQPPEISLILAMRADTIKTMSR